MAVAKIIIFFVTVETGNSRRTSKAFEDQDETDVLYVTGSAASVTAELPDSPTILRRLESEKALYSVVNESIPRNTSYSSSEMPHSSSQHPSPTLPHQSHHPVSYQTPSPPHHSPARKRSSIKRTSISRNQSNASNLSPAIATHRRKEEKPTKSSLVRSPEDDRKKMPKRPSQAGFRIGSNSSTDVSSDESQTPLVSRSTNASAQIKKVTSSTTKPH